MPKTYNRRKFPPIPKGNSLTAAPGLGDQSQNQILENMKLKHLPRAGNHKVSYFFYKDGCYMSKVDRLPHDFVNAPKRANEVGLFNKLNPAYYGANPNSLAGGSVFGRGNGGVNISPSKSSLISSMAGGGDGAPGAGSQGFSPTNTTSTSDNKNFKLSRQINKIAAEKVINVAKENRSLSVNGLNFGKCHRGTLKRYGRYGRCNLIGHYGKEASLTSNSGTAGSGNGGHGTTADAAMNRYMPRYPNAAEVNRAFKKQRFEKDIIPATSRLDFDNSSRAGSNGFGRLKVWEPSNIKS